MLLVLNLLLNNFVEFVFDHNFFVCFSVLVYLGLMEQGKQVRLKC